MARATQSLLACALAVVAAAPASAQVIPIRIVPIAEGDQFGFFPSANYGMANVSIALADSLRDPFQNPALGGRVRRGLYSGGPSLFAVTNDAGSGTTFPIAGVTRLGRAFVGAALAVQDIEPAERRAGFVGPASFSSFIPFVEAEPNRTEQNQYAQGMLGYVLPGGLAVGVSGLWSNLRAMEGMDLLFTGSQNVRQRGHHSDVRLGASKQWGRRTLDAVLLRSSQRMAYDVGYAELYWDPGIRQQVVRTFVDHHDANARTDGLHLRYETALRDTAWRAGAIATANVSRESAAPYYEFQGITRDASRTRAFNFGLGVSRRTGPLTLALDAVAEPAWRRATGVADTATASAGVGGNREENYFKFRNLILRGGVARDIVASSGSRLRLQAGMQVRAVSYTLEQHDVLRGTFRERASAWREWTHGGGATFAFTRFEFGYQLRVLSGMGRIGVPPEDDVFLPLDSFAPGPITPSITMYPVRVASHQMFFTVPLR